MRINEMDYQDTEIIVFSKRLKPSSAGCREFKLYEEKIKQLESKLSAARLLLRYLFACGKESFGVEQRQLEAEKISAKLFSPKDGEDKYWCDCARELFEVLLILLPNKCQSQDPIQELFGTFSMTNDIWKLSNELTEVLIDSKNLPCKYLETIRQFLGNFEIVRKGIVSHMHVQLYGLIHP